MLVSTVLFLSLNNRKCNEMKYNDHAMKKKKNWEKDKQTRKEGCFLHIRKILKKEEAAAADDVGIKKKCHVHFDEENLFKQFDIHFDYVVDQ